MKKLATRLAIIAMSVLFTTHYLPSCTFNKDDEREYENESEEGEEREAGVEKEMMSWFQSRGYPNPYYMESKYMAAWEQAQKLKEQSSNIYSRVQGGSNWVSLGPSTGIGGRILSIAIDPANNNNLFAGSASGGIWKSTNGGTSWSHVNCNLPVLGVPAIIINPSNSNVIYAGTGEVYRFDSTSGTPNPGNTGYSVWKTRGTYGIGIIKSTDGGATWSQVFTKNTAQLFGIQSLKFDPSNSNTVYACTTQGLYRSTNAGTTWSNILDLTYISDVVINGTSIVAAVGNLQNTMKGIYKSTNSGTTWTKITSGLPASFLGSVKMDWVSSDPNTIMASFGVSEVSNVKELYRSTDFGTTWSALSNSTHTQWQYWCAHVVAINPSNTNKLVFGGVKLKNYTVSTSTAGSALTIHDDIHDIKFDPSNANNVYAACDGGIYKSTNGGTSFTAINNGLAATQFYATIGVSPTNANVIVGGLQDNGVVMTTNGGTTWTTYPGSYGDGASCAIDPTNGNKILSSGDARNVYLSTNGGSSTSSNGLTYLGGANDSRTAFNSPLTFAKGKPSIVYVGSDNLHKSTDGGNSFSGGSGTPGTSYIEALHKTALTISVDPSDATGNLLYASTSPFAQYDNDVDNLYVTGQPNILKSTNGGTTLPMTSVKGSLPDRFVLDITFSPTYHDSVYITLGGFGTS
ncbi:MAG: hypothetical protein JSU05_06330, partial [Bacteroidetes bacterium]|nr:hypothetical protein [Bacteroidota bacterium]